MNVVEIDSKTVSGWPAAGFPQWMRSSILKQIPPPDTTRAEGQFRLLRLEVFVPSYEVTPALASVMLRSNTHNRNCRRRMCEEMAAHMKAGKWPVTGEPLIFADDGTLNDGQHRLVACLIAGVPFRTDIRFGIERDAFAFTGVGARRTAADVLMVTGINNARNVSGALRLVKSWQANDLLFQTALHPGEAPDVAKANPDIIGSVKMAEDWKRRRGMPVPAATAAFLHYILSRDAQGNLDDDRAAAAALFFDRLSAGTNLEDDDPIFVLREKLIADTRFPKRMSKYVMIRAVLFAWKRHRANRKLSKLSIRESDPYPMPDYAAGTR